MHADVPNHEPSLLLMNCGEARLIRPSMGSWVTYGLGTENQNLPGFIAMCPGGYPIQESQNWQSGFLPGVYQGTYIDTQHTDLEKLIENIRNTQRVAAREQRQQLDLLQQLNQQHLEQRRGDRPARSPHPVVRAGLPHADATPTDAFDVSREPQHIRDMYGPGVQARQMLIARRLLEQGVRFVQVWHGAGPAVGQPRRHRSQPSPAGAANATRRSAPCLSDLKQRGMLDEHAGDLGRRVRPHADGRTADAGRQRRARSTAATTTITASPCGWPAAASRAATSTAPPTSSASQAVENQVHVHDLHATILHLLGFDHEKLHLPLRRPRLPADRRAWAGGAADSRLNPRESSFPNSCLATCNVSANGSLQDVRSQTGVWERELSPRSQTPVWECE